MVCAFRSQGLEEPDVAKKAHFDSVEDMNFRLRRWGLPGLVRNPAGGSTPQAKQRKVNGGDGNRTELPPAAAAHHLFESAMERFRRASKQLPLRRDYRQDGHVVSELSVPLLDNSAEDPGYTYVIAPPDAEPNEHGETKFTLAEAHILVPAGAGRFPEEQYAAVIGTTVLFGESVDELLDLMRPGADDETRKKVYWSKAKTD